MISKRTQFIVAITLIGNAAIAEPWEDIIPKVAERAAFYTAEAEQRFEIAWNDSVIAGDVPFEGSVEATIGSDSAYAYVREDHRCAILGRMLGVPELISEEERIDVPELSDAMSNDDIVRLWAAGRSYQLWVQQASMLVGEGLVEKADIWNKSCANWDRIRDAPKFLVSAGPGYGNFPATGFLADGETTVMPDFDGRDEWARSFRTRIRDGLAVGPNFAGHYTIIMFGCGASCRGYFLADTKNGQVFDLPFGGESSPEISIDFRDDSRLIYARQVGDTFDECALQAFAFDGSEFTEVHKEQWPRDGACNTGWFQVITE